MLRIDDTGRQWAALRMIGLHPDRMGRVQLARCLQALESGEFIPRPDYVREPPKFGVGWDEEICRLSAGCRAERGS